MLGRFTVRPSNDGDGTYGVWDGAVNGWRASGLTSDLEAEKVKADLDLQFNAHGPRPAKDIRVVTPAKPVQYAADWRSGELDAWILDAGEWLGRVRDPNGHTTWIPGTALRQPKTGAP